MYAHLTHTQLKHLQCLACDLHNSLEYNHAMFGHVVSSLIVRFNTKQTKIEVKSVHTTFNNLVETIKHQTIRLHYNSVHNQSLQTSQSHSNQIASKLLCWILRMQTAPSVC